MPIKKIVLENTDQAVNVLGRDDSNLHLLEEKFNIQAYVKRDHSTGDVSLVLKGPRKRLEKAMEHLAPRLENWNVPEKSFLENGNAGRGKALDQVFQEHPDAVYVTHINKPIMAKSDNQRQYVQAMKNNDLVIAFGPAGTGKTFLAVAYGLRCLKEGKVSRIVLTRPVVEAGEKLGFLPGDLYEKVYPYLKPLYDAFFMMLGPEKFKALQVTETIEIVPLAYMRGRTLEDAFIILDEAQNTTQTQMKMFLTRMGRGSKIVITGDTTQIDLENKKLSGLEVTESILNGIPGVVFIKLNEQDVVRHDIVRHVIRAYEEWENREANSKQQPNRPSQYPS